MNATLTNPGGEKKDLKTLLIIIIILVVIALMNSCKKDYGLLPSPFQKGDKVTLVGIDPRKSFQPYDCCTCPCTVDTVYRDINYPNYWFYNITDQRDSSLTHVPNDDLRKIK